MKAILFPDIHGRIDLLIKVVESLEETCSLQEYDLIFLGDYIDRGKQSFEVISYLIDLNKKYKCIFLKGNHEQLFLDWFNKIDIMSDLYEKHNGGDSTIRSYYENGYDLFKGEIPQEHLTFYNSLKLFYQTEEYFFSHAGIKSNINFDTLDITSSEILEDMLTWSVTNFSSDLSKDLNYENDKFCCAGHYVVEHIIHNLGRRFNKRILEEKKVLTEIEQHLLDLFKKYSVNAVKRLPKEAFSHFIIGKNFAYLDLGCNLTNYYGCLILPEKKQVLVKGE